MKTVLQAVFVAAATLVLSACASSGGMASAPAGTAPLQGERIVTDAEYVAAVERSARERRVDVQWVNPPTKRYVRMAAR